MDSARTTKEIITEWCYQHLSTHTDWTGTRVETKFKCSSVEEFIDMLWEHIDSNHWRA